MSRPDALILFDGVCNLCQGAVQFVIKRDTHHYFTFSSLQGNMGQSTIQQYQLSPDKLDSFILVERGKCYTESTAALRVVRKLNGAWPLLYVFMIVPPFIRNAVYKWIAANRYRWFGKTESCMLPTPELKERFLD